MNLTEIIGMPFERMLFSETEHTVLLFGSLCSMIKNKKMNKQQVLGLLLSDKRYLSLLSEMLDSDNECETLQSFILSDRDGVLAKSKHVRSLI